MIPLRKFTQRPSRKDELQKVSSTTDRQRSPLEASDDEAPGPGLTQSSPQGKLKSKLASRPAPLSDDSDFDKNEEEDDDHQRQKPKRQTTDRKSGNRGSSSARKTSPKGNARRTDSSTSSLEDDLEVADDDSQTFAGFKMRVAKQEQARREVEREERRSKPTSQRKCVIDIDDDEGVDGAEHVASTSNHTQSIQVSRHKPFVFPAFALGESLPYQQLKAANRSAIAAIESEDEGEDEEVNGIGRVKADPLKEGKDKMPGKAERDEAPRHGKTLLDLLLIDERKQHAASGSTRLPGRGTSEKGSDTDSDAGAQSKMGEEVALVPEVTSTQPAAMAEEQDVEDMGADDLSTEDEDDFLVFDTDIGKLIRPPLLGGKSPTSNPLPEEGQSEEEDGYQPSLADEKPPRKSSGDYLGYLVKRARITAAENAKAERQAQELGMKPSFKCSAAKQRKKPYRLDPFNDKMVIPIANSRFLRRYQRIGIQWFYDRYKGIKVEGIGVVKGGILGDDMGLGKTIQVLGFLSAIMEKTGTQIDLTPRLSRKERVRARHGTCNPFTFGPTCLITCPKTLVGNWKREIETWTNLEYGVIESKPDRDVVIQKYKNGFLDLVLIPFDRLVSDVEALESVSFSIMIIDEAHNIKNPTASRTLAMKRIKAECRFAMTGTLIQNRFQEMWSVLDFVVPGLVGTHRDWKQVMAKTVDEGMDQKATIASIAKRKRITDALHKNILPLLFLRRTKAEVASELPEKNDHVIFCPFRPVQERAYKRILDQPDLQAYLKRNGPCPTHPEKRAKDCCYKAADAASFDEVDKGVVFKYIDVCKKVSSHIGLIYSDPDDTPEQKELCQRLQDICFPLSRTAQLEQIGLIDRTVAKRYIPEDHAIVGEDLGPVDSDSRYRSLKPYQASMESEFSGKWVILHALLRSWKEDAKGQHKVLIFSSSVKLLKMLGNFLDREYNYEMLHGGIKDEERMAAVDRFQTDKNVFVFLISTLAGGVGLNLTAANKVIIFDPNWNPANDLQAMDRAFRMGQKRDVDVYRLISLGTIEEIIYERQMRKSAAMRIIYDDAADSRVYVGHEGSGVTGDLWGVNNLFKYSPEGTSLQRAARLASEEGGLADNLRGVVHTAGISTLKIDTSYEGGSDLVPQGTEKGTEISAVSEDAALLEAIGDFFPGLRRERAKVPSKNSAVEQFILQQAVEDYHNNPSARSRPANEYYRDANVVKQMKRKGTSLKRKSDGSEADGERKAPRLTVAKSGLLSDDDD